MSRKKALCLASMASNLDNFSRNNVRILQNLGCDVTLASNFCTEEDTNSQTKIDSFAKEMEEEGVHIVQVDFSRRISNIRGHIVTYKQIQELLKKDYDLIHCHAPICAAITRICAKKYRKTGTKVIYTAHGFHFYDNAPFKNWILFYPIEKWLSRYTDVLITINREDFKRAKEKLHAKKTEYVPGVGIDTLLFGSSNRGAEKRKDLKLEDDDTIFLSVGELNDNKNHEALIRALGIMKSKGVLPDSIYYIIAGIGNKEEVLKQLIHDQRLDGRVKLIGYQSSIADYYDAADVFAFPSFREGLSVSLMEAMASNLPVICSRIRGNTDLIDEGKGGFFFNPNDINSVVDAINKVLESDRKELGGYNAKKIKMFDNSTVNKIVKTIYWSCLQ